MTQHYSHSIRHKLFIAIRIDELEYAITDANLALLTTGRLAVTDFEMLQSVLSNTKELNEIYNDTTVTFCGNNFLCHPSIFTNSEDRRRLFLGSHQLNNTENLCKGSISDDITISFSCDTLILDALKSKFPNLHYRHDLAVFVDYLLSEIKPTTSSIALCNMGENTLMVVMDKENLQLMNQFQTKDLQDIFYFSMLAIEQLDLDIEELTLYWLQQDQIGSWESIKTLFESYVRNLQLIKQSQTVNPAITMAIACG